MPRQLDGGEVLAVTRLVEKVLVHLKRDTGLKY